MSEWVSKTIFVPATHVDDARQICAALAGPAGDGMFERGAAETKTAAATYYVSAGMVSAEFAALLSADAATIGAYAASMGIEIDVSRVAQLLNVADISDEPVEAVLDRLGVVLLDRVAGMM
jgi:hypothetical protein